MNQEEAAKLRLWQLRECLPTLLNGELGNTMLYVGARPDRCQMAPELKAAGWHLTLLEAWQPNADYYSKGKGQGIFEHVICGDVRDVIALAAYHQMYWDVTFWWHGPEHVPQGQLGSILKGLQAVSGRCVITGCPWGLNGQDASYGNPYEVHQSALTPEVFQELGYRTSAMGEPNKIWSNILAYRHAWDTVELLEEAVEGNLESPNRS